jgi:predicted transcriptional regulator
MSDQENTGVELLALTTEVVAAYVNNNTVSASEVSSVIRLVFNCLKAVGIETSAEVQTAATPAISIKKSVTPDAIICLNCGKPMKMLKRHLSAEHGLSLDEYKASWNLPSTYPVVAPNYAASRSAMAKKIGLGHKPKAKRGRKKTAE